MATPTKLSIYQKACLLCKQRPITALTDDVEIRYTMDQCYEETLAWALEQGLWNFASRLVELTASEDEEPVFGFNYAFDQPSDYVRLVRMSASDQLWPVLEDMQYTEEGDRWYSSANPIYVQYVSDDSAYGADFSLWPSTYTLFVQHELAFRIAPHVTSFSAAEMDYLQAQRDRALKDARSKDAMEQGAMRPPPGRLTSARGGYNQMGRGRSPWWR